MIFSSEGFEALEERRGARFQGGGEPCQAAAGAVKRETK